MEFNEDHVTILNSASKTGFTSVAGLAVELGWKEHRAQTVLEQLVKDGMAWVDDQAEGGARSYWFPGINVA